MLLSFDAQQSYKRSLQKSMENAVYGAVSAAFCNYSPIDSSNLHQGDYFPAYLGNMQKVFHIFSE